MGYMICSWILIPCSDSNVWATSCVYVVTGSVRYPSPNRIVVGSAPRWWRILQQPCGGMPLASQDLNDSVMADMSPSFASGLLRLCLYPAASSFCKPIDNTVCGSSASSSVI